MKDPLENNKLSSIIINIKKSLTFFDFSVMHGVFLKADLLQTLLQTFKIVQTNNGGSNS